jgi:hypothetical protein
VGAFGVALIVYASRRNDSGGAIDEQNSALGVRRHRCENVAKCCDSRCTGALYHYIPAVRRGPCRPRSAFRVAFNMTAP